MNYAVVFDLDGTLLDTLDDLADAINYAMLKLGYPGKSDAEVLAAIGSGIRRAITSVLPDGPDADPDTVDAALALFRERYAECFLSKTRPYPGVTEALRELRGKGYKIAVISNKSDEYTGRLVEKHFGGLVDASAGERPGVPLKPNPGALFEILSRAGCDAGRTVYVGDSDVDYETAKNAGVPCVLVSWGFRSRDVLINTGIDPALIADAADGMLKRVYSLAAKRKSSDKTLWISDLDGTLFGADAGLSEFTASALNRLISEGMDFSVATARSPESVFKLMSPVRMRAPVVMMNGVLIYGMAEGRYLEVADMTPASARQVVRSMRRFGTSGFMYVLDDGVLKTYYETLEPAPLRQFHEERTRLFGKLFVKTSSFEKLIDAGARVIYFTLRGGYADMLPPYDEILQIPDLTVSLCEDNYIAGYYFLECFSDRASKHAAVNRLRAYGNYGRVVGFGDNLNDLSLFSACDECYAPSNAKAELKAAANAVIGANTDDGVARFLLSCLHGAPGAIRHV